MGWIFKLTAGVILLIILFLTAVTIFKIPVDLTRFKEPIEAIASDVFNRPVTIEKSIVLSTSLEPVFTLEGLRISDPGESASDTLMYLALARIQLELLPLLKKKLHIAEFSVHKLELNLEERADGSVNWVIDGDDTTTPEIESAEQQTAPDSNTNGKKPSLEVVSDTIVIKTLSLKDIIVTYHTPEKNELSRYELSSCEGTMLPGKPLNLDIHGNIKSFPYTLGVEIAALDEFLLDNKSWMNITANIAETDLDFEGDINLAQAHRSLLLQARVAGDNLNSLNDLLKLDLPPLTGYGAEAIVLIKQDHVELKNLLIKTGTSSLEGTAKIIRDGARYDAELNLEAPLVQIDDFTFENWPDPGNNETVAPSTAEGKTQEQVAEQSAKPTGASEEEKMNRKLVDPEFLATIDATISIRAAQVLSGKDDLGSGSMDANLRDGRIAIEPLELNIPGGSIHMAASLKPGTDSSDASLSLKIENFDIGILIRRTKPESAMGGQVNLDVDLAASAASFEQILANGNGYFDFSGQLTNIQAGIIDLWAVNLVAAIVSSSDENQSQINCIVGRWGVKDGILTPDLFVVDTSKMRICGSGTVDFKKQSLELDVTPKAKKAEFFSLATPLKVSGTFDDIGLGVKQGGMVGSAFHFITSPITTPIKRVILDKIPEDGSDVCATALGPQNRTDIDVPGCR